MSGLPSPRLPTVEQVATHEQCGGLWRYNRPSNGAVGFQQLRVLSGVVVVWAAERWGNAAGDGCCTWTPCDRDGNPLPLVEELAQARERGAAEERAAIVAYILSEADPRYGDPLPLFAARLLAAAIARGRHHEQRQPSEHAEVASE